MIKKYFPMILCCVVVSMNACSVYHINTVPKSSALEQPKGMSVQGIYTHKSTGLRFPQSVAGFTMAEITQFDTAGANVSIGYDFNDPVCGIVATAYVYPINTKFGMTYIGANPKIVKSQLTSYLVNEFSGVKKAIETKYPGAVLKAESPVQAAAPDRILKAVYSLPAGAYADIPVQSEAWLYIYDYDWFIKYRFSYPASCSGSAKAKIDEFVKALGF